MVLLQLRHLATAVDDSRAVVDGARHAAIGADALARLSVGRELVDGGQRQDLPVVGGDGRVDHQ